MNHPGSSMEIRTSIDSSQASGPIKPVTVSQSFEKGGAKINLRASDSSPRKIVVSKRAINFNAPMSPGLKKGDMSPIRGVTRDGSKSPEPRRRQEHEGFGLNPTSLEPGVADSQEVVIKGKRGHKRSHGRYDISHDDDNPYMDHSTQGKTTASHTHSIYDKHSKKEESKNKVVMSGHAVK